MRWRSFSPLFLACVLGFTGNFASAVDLDSALAKVRAVGPKGEGHSEAIAALKELRETTTKDLLAIIAAMDGASPIACNWLRSVAEAAVERGNAAGQALPVKELEAFFHDHSHSPLGRRFAYELISSVDPSAEARLIPLCLNDESIELRRDAVAMLLKKAEAAEKSGQADETLQMMSQAFEAARMPEQVKAIAAKLKKLGKEVDVPAHFGLLQTWHVIGPFDHTDNKAFDLAYPPESGVALSAKLTGKKGEVEWKQVTTTNPDALVDINSAVGAEKFAVAYAFNEFISDKDQEIEVRYGSPNATKVWVNGELVAAYDVYHAGYELDQYRGKGKLKKGKNQILVKICQNNQQEQWAHDWVFMLRVCDRLGTAVLSTDRPVVKVESSSASANSDAP